MAELDIVYAKQYGANVYQVAQQRGSRFRNYVTIEDMKGEIKFLERVKPTSAVRVTSKYADSPMIHTQFDRRALHAQEFAWGDMIDWQDNLNIFIDPTSHVTKQGVYALGRVIDEIIIENGFDGVAYEGKNGTDVVQFPTSQVIPVTAGGAGGSNTGMNIEKLRMARSAFGKADIDLDDPDNKLYMAISQEQLDDLLRTTEITSADYNTVKALVNGTVSSFMGFEFIVSQRLKKTGENRICAAWCKSGIVLAMPQEIVTRVAEREDKCFNWYAFGKMKTGCTRIEDCKVVQIPCKES